MEENQPIVLDIGSVLVKAGFGSENEPHAVFPTVVGHPRHRGIMVGMGQKDCYVGDEAYSKCGILVYEYPVQRGLTSDWHYVEKIWHHTFYNELRCAPEEQPVIILEHPLTPKESREKTAQIMFDTLNVPSLFFANPSVAAVRAVGRTNGVVLSMGGQSTYSMVVKDGKGMIETLKIIDIGSQDTYSNLSKYLNTKTPDSFTTSYEQEIVRHMSDTLGYIALDYDSELQRPENEVAVGYADPGGEIRTLHHELFTHNEILFKPELYGLEVDGIHEMIYQSIMKCDPSIHNELFNNIVLTGGKSLTRGLDARLIKELKILAPSHSDHIKIESGPFAHSRQYLSFIGASMLSMRMNPADWITRITLYLVAELVAIIMAKIRLTFLTHPLFNGQRRD